MIALYLVLGAGLIGLGYWLGMRTSLGSAQAVLAAAQAIAETTRSWSERELDRATTEAQSAVRIEALSASTLRTASSLDKAADALGELARSQSVIYSALVAANIIQTYHEGRSTAAPMGGPPPDLPELPRTDTVEALEKLLR